MKISTNRTLVGLLVLKTRVGPFLENLLAPHVGKFAGCAKLEFFCKIIARTHMFAIGYVDPLILAAALGMLV